MQLQWNDGRGNFEVAERRNLLSEVTMLGEDGRWDMEMGDDGHPVSRKQA